MVVLGSGAFACEAMEAALASNAQHVTIICRDRKRYPCSACAWSHYNWNYGIFNREGSRSASGDLQSAIAQFEIQSLSS